MNKLTYMIVILLSLSCAYKSNSIGYNCDNNSSENRLIVKKIPSYTDTRFNNSAELDSLINLFRENMDNTVMVEIYIFTGGDQFVMDCSTRLSKHLSSIVSERISGHSITFSGKGNLREIFFDKSNQNEYLERNTRMEILIK